MHTFALWCGFFGAWLLVVGPVYQAALELADEQIERDLFDRAAAKVPPPPPVSPWWWLLPPVGYVLNRRRSAAQKQAVMAALTHDEMARLVRYMNKATGWMLVALGALCIAAKETWEITEHFEWSVMIFWALMVVMGLASTLFTVARMRMTHQLTSEGVPADGDGAVRTLS